MSDITDLQAEIEAWKVNLSNEQGMRIGSTDLEIKANFTLSKVLELLSTHAVIDRLTAIEIVRFLEDAGEDFEKDEVQAELARISLTPIVPQEPPQ